MIRNNTILKKNRNKKESVFNFLLLCYFEVAS